MAEDRHIGPVANAAYGAHARAREE